MSFLAFQDDELNYLIDTINQLQMFYHHTYAPLGKFDSHNIFEIQAKDDVMIIADKNLVSPVCEMVKHGSLKDVLRMRKTAMFVLWGNYLNARTTCGLGLLENDTAGLSTVTGETTRKLFLHGINNVPSQIWKNIAFGYISEIPKEFLYTSEDEVVEEETYICNDDLLLLCNEDATIKLVQLIRTKNVSGVDKFITFMNWYADNMDVAESVIVYAALVFCNAQNISKPKFCDSKNYDKVVKGIKNQAWDLTYITQWSTMYYNETDQKKFLFATDDITQKFIVANILPIGHCCENVYAAFETKSSHKKLDGIFNVKLGDTRIRPFKDKSKEDNIKTVRALISKEQDSLKAMVTA